MGRIAIHDNPWQRIHLKTHSVPSVEDSLEDIRPFRLFFGVLSVDLFQGQEGVVPFWRHLVPGRVRGAGHIGVRQEGHGGAGQAAGARVLVVRVAADHRT